MTADALDLRAMATELAQEFGVSAVMVVPAPSYTAATGTVVESPSESTVTLAGPFDEARRYAATGADSRVTATFYMPAGQSVTPLQGFRIEFGGRAWQVITVGTISLQGLTVAWQLDCAEGAAP